MNDRRQAAMPKAVEDCHDLLAWIIPKRACISHHLSTAAAQWHALTGVRSVGPLNVVSTMPARPLVANASHDAPLNALATNGGEKSRLDGFPRVRRYTLGERIETRLLSVLECLVAAAYNRRRAEHLARANQDLDVVRHLWRLAHTLDAVQKRAYQQGASQFLGLGRQIGGWRKGAGRPA
ncbi:MAG: four helix bundle protein [Gammaproteobacteria bacterium]